MFLGHQIFGRIFFLRQVVGLLGLVLCHHLEGGPRAEEHPLHRFAERRLVHYTAVNSLLFVVVRVVYHFLVRLVLVLCCRLVGCCPQLGFPLSLRLV